MSPCCPSSNPPSHDARGHRHWSGKQSLGVSMCQAAVCVLCSPPACTQLLPGFGVNFRCRIYQRLV